MQNQVNGMKLNGDKIKLKKESITIKGRIRFIDNDPNNPYTDKGAKVIYGKWKDNILTTIGKQMILNRLKNAALIANEGIITYGAVGTGTTLPAVGDTQLVTELDRALVSYSNLAGTVLSIRVYYAKADAVGVITEFGWFGEDAGVAANSGTLFNRILYSKTKTAAKTLTVEQEITIS